MATIIPACLTDLIGIQPCEGVSPYLRHLTELEGLSIASVAATADPPSTQVGLQKTAFFPKNPKNPKKGRKIQKMKNGKNGKRQI